MRKIKYRWKNFVVRLKRLHIRWRRYRGEKFISALEPYYDASGEEFPDEYQGIDIWDFGDN